MKKIIFLLLLIAVGFFGWKYFKNPTRTLSPPEQVLDSAGSYVPGAIERKNVMEDKINDSMSKENERLQNSLKEIN